MLQAKVKACVGIVSVVVVVATWVLPSVVVVVCCTGDVGVVAVVPELVVAPSLLATVVCSSDCYMS